jgi:hypothetical protein
MPMLTHIVFQMASSSPYDFRGNICRVELPQMHVLASREYLAHPLLAP